MNEEQLQELYKAYGLDKKGTFDEFKTDMQDKAIRQEFFKSYGLDKKGTFDEFENEFGFKQETQQQEQPPQEASWWETISKPFQSIFADRIPSAYAASKVEGDNFFEEAKRNYEFNHSPEFKEIERTKDKDERGQHIWSEAEYRKRYKERIENAYKNFIGEEQFNKEKEQYNKNRIQSALEAYKEMDIQDKEAADKLKGIPQTFGETQGAEQVGKYIAGSASEMAGQLIPSIATFGTSSYPMERVEILKEGLEAKAKAQGKSVDELINSGDINDIVDLADNYAGLNAALDMASLGTGVGAITKKAVGKKIIDRMVEKPFLKLLLKGKESIGGRVLTATAAEVPTEMWQEVNTIAASKVASSIGEGHEIGYADAIDQFNDSDWERVKEAGIKAATGTAVLGGIGASVRVANQEINKSDAGEFNNEIDQATKEAEQVVTDKLYDTQKGEQISSPVGKGQGNEQTNIQEKSTEETSPDRVVQTPPEQITPEKTSEVTIKQEPHEYPNGETENLETLRTSKGYSKFKIVGDKASVVEIEANKKEDGTREQGGKLWEKTIDHLRSQGVKSIYLIPSNDTNKVLTKLAERGDITPIPTSEIIKGTGYGAYLINEKGTPKKTNEKITIPVRDQVRNLIKTFTEGQEKGGRKIMKMTTDQTKKIIELLKENKLSQAQVKQVVRKLGQINYFTESGVAKFNQFLGKVQQDAVFADKLEQATQSKKKLRNAPKAVPANLKQLGKALAKVDLDHADIDKFNELAEKLKSAYVNPAKSSGKTYEGVKAYEIQSFVDRALEKQAQETQEVVDESETEAQKTKREQEQKDRLKVQAFYLKPKLLKTAEGKQGEYLKSLKDFDIENASVSDLSTFIRVADNIVNNDNYSQAAEVWALKESQERANKIEKAFEGKKVSKLGSVLNIGRSLQQLYSKLTNDSNLATSLIRNLGLQEIDKATSEAERIVHAKEVALEKELDSLAKKHKKDIRNDINERIKLRLLAELGKYTVDPREHIEKVKSNIERDIIDYQAVDPEFSAELQKEYDKISKLESADEVIDHFKKNEKLVYDIWYWLKTNMYNKQLSEESKTTYESLHNGIYIEEQNHLPTNFTRIKQSARTEEEIRAGEMAPTTKPSASGQFKVASRSRLKDHTYDYANSLGSMVNSFASVVNDNKTSDYQRVFHETIKRPEVTKALGVDNVSTLVKDYERRAGLNKNGDELAGLSGVINNMTEVFKHIAIIDKLASVKQYFAQYLPGFVGMMAQLGPKYAGHLFTWNLPKNFEENVINKSAVGVRGLREVGLNIGNDFKVSDKYVTGKRLRNAIETTSKMRRYSYNLSSKALRAVGLTQQDVNLVKRGWTAFYLKKLNELGVDNVNLETEENFQGDEKRKEAAAYATNMISEAQNPSTKFSQSQLQSLNGTNRVIMTALFPFSTFAFNFKLRIIQAMNKMRFGNKKEGWQELRGALTEATTFGAIQAAWYKFFVGGIATAIWQNLLDLEDDEEEEDTTLGFTAKEWQDFRTQLFNDINPASVGMGTNASDEILNFINYVKDQPNVDYFNYRRNREDKWINLQTQSNTYGSYGMATNVLTDWAWSMNNVYQTKANDTYYKWNNLYPPSKKEVEGLEDIAVIDALLNSFRLVLPVEIKSSFKKVKKQAEKKAKRKEESIEEE